MLALVSVFASVQWSVTVSRHLATLLLFTFGVYVYRDIYPLLTYNVEPQDSQDSVLWATVSLLAITSSVIPMIMPRRYVPVDPKVGMFIPPGIGTYISFIRILRNRARNKQHLSYPSVFTSFWIPSFGRHGKFLTFLTISYLLCLMVILR